jgi:hypothetical protein
MEIYSSNADKEKFDREISISKTMWDEFRYRHEVYWRIVQWSVLAQTFLLSTPFILKSEYPEWSNLIFPLIAGLFTFASFKILQGESIRMIGPVTLYRELLLNQLSEDARYIYIVAKWKKEKFIVEKSDISAFFPKSLAEIITIYFRNTEPVSKASIAKVMPIIWLIYGLSTSFLVFIACIAILIFE